jgi:capsular polysaccharide biosynthesis protein
LIASRDAILRNFPPRKPKRRAYISRNRPGVSRHIANEAELKQLIAKYGFEEYFNEDHSVAEQISYFSECAAIIGSHGSGTVNSMFMPEGALIVDLYSPLRYVYRNILLSAKALKQRYYAIVPHYSEKLGYRRDDAVVADLDLIEKTLEQELT